MKWMSVYVETEEERKGQDRGGELDRGGKRNKIDMRE